MGWSTAKKLHDQFEKIKQINDKVTHTHTHTRAHVHIHVHTYTERIPLERSFKATTRPGGVLGQVCWAVCWALTHAPSHNRELADDDDDPYDETATTTTLWSPEETEDLDNLRQKDISTLRKYLRNADSPLREDGQQGKRSDEEKSEGDNTTPPVTIPTLIKVG